MLSVVLGALFTGREMTEEKAALFMNFVMGLLALVSAWVGSKLASS